VAHLNNFRRLAVAFDKLLMKARAKGCNGSVNVISPEVSVLEAFWMVAMLAQLKPLFLQK
jgi:hypothetical protein